MELSSKQQAIELIKGAKNILIITPSSDGDSLGTAIALKLTLDKLDKKSTIVSQENVSPKLEFLPSSNILEKDLSSAKNFVIQIDVSKSPIEKLGYNIEDGKLNIIISPQSKEIDKNKVSFQQGSSQHDLIVTIDTQGVESLGQQYQQNKEIFQNVPIINIDHNSDNNYFGKVNLVDLTATSSAEILISIIEALGGEKQLFDADISTALLTGITSDTGSFQNTNTTPKSLTVAAQLVAFGARQQEIIKNLYRKRSLTTLRLWGRVLAAIREDANIKFVWSTVSLRDFQQTGVEKSEILGVMDQFLTSATSAEIIVLLIESENKTEGIVRTLKNANAAEVAQLFGGTGDAKKADFQMSNVQLGTAEKELIEKIRNYQQQRLSQQ